MENASKALIIAGGVLIAIMIITLGLYIFQSAGTLSQSYAERLAEDAINTYNNKFLTYCMDINAQNMVTLINLIKENNNKNQYIQEMQVILFIDETPIDIYSISDDWKINIMTQEENYEFITVKYNEDGYISQISFKRVLNS